MAVTRNAHDSTSTKKDVVLWLWRTHNKVHFSACEKKYASLLSL
jgi:hypothetical protein